MRQDDYPTRQMDVGGSPPPAQRPGAGYVQAKTMLLQPEAGPQPLAWLVIVGGPYAGHLFRIEPAGSVIGRDPACEIAVDDGAVSRRHARVRSSEEEGESTYIVHDLDSENHTWVNGEQVTKQMLKDNDYIKVGQTELVFKQVVPRKAE